MGTWELLVGGLARRGWSLKGGKGLGGGGLGRRNIRSRSCFSLMLKRRFTFLIAFIVWCVSEGACVWYVAKYGPPHTRDGVGPSRIEERVTHTDLGGRGRCAELYEGRSWWYKMISTGIAGNECLCVFRKLGDGN